MISTLFPGIEVGSAQWVAAMHAAFDALIARLLAAIAGRLPAKDGSE